MERFHIIEEGTVIIRTKGLFRQVKVYHRGKDVFAGYAGGFIKLHTGSATSRPDTSWVDIEAEGVTLNRAGGQPGFSE